MRGPGSRCHRRLPGELIACRPTVSSGPTGAGLARMPLGGLGSLQFSRRTDSWQASPPFALTGRAGLNELLSRCLQLPIGWLLDCWWLRLALGRPEMRRQSHDEQSQAEIDDLDRGGTRRHLPEDQDFHEDIAGQDHPRCH